MTISSIGDLAKGFALRQQSNFLNQKMATLSEELSSGVASDVTQHLSGNFTQLSDITHKLSLLESYRTVAEQGRLETSVMQTALDQIQAEAGLLAGTALSIGTSPGGGASFAGFAEEARGALTTVLASLSVSAGGRALFSGEDVDVVAVVPPDTFLTEIETAVAGAASAADINTALDTFFDTPGGAFETQVYQGATSARGSYPLGSGESLRLDLRADDPTFRDVLKQISIASLMDSASVTITDADRVILTRQVGEQLLAAQNKVTAVQSDLGFAESRIDRAATRISTEMSALSMVQSEILSIDPFETATELETVQLRLETLYTLTSRMSRLNLVNFLS